MRQIIVIFYSWVMLFVAAYAHDMPDDFVAGRKQGWFSIEVSPADILGREQALSFAPELNPDQDIEFLIYVPESWKPGEPLGLLSYITPRRAAILPAGWGAGLEETGMIFIEVNGSGNTRRGTYRAYETLLSTYLIANYYPVDQNRVYIAGFSGGGRMASLLAPRFADLYRGAIFICGVDRLEPSDEQTELMKQNRYVFYTGRRDQNRRETKSVYTSYKNAGITQVRLIDDNNATHQTPPKRHLVEAIRFLDGEEVP